MKMYYICTRDIAFIDALPGNNSEKMLFRKGACFTFEFNEKYSSVFDNKLLHNSIAVIQIEIIGSYISYGISREDFNDLIISRRFLLYKTEK